MLRHALRPKSKADHCEVYYDTVKHDLVVVPREPEETGLETAVAVVAWFVIWFVIGSLICLAGLAIYRLFGG